MKCLSQVGPENAKSEEVNILLLKLIKGHHINDEATILLRQPHLKLNQFYHLFEALVFGDYERFGSIDQTLLKKEGINEGDLEKRLKIQAIPRIFNGVTRASYHQVADSLKIKKEEVEEYIIEAIREGILKAKID